MTAEVPIASLSTSVTAFVGVSIKGPPGVPSPIHSFVDYETQFGELNPLSPMSFAVQQFLLNGGPSCFVVSAGTALRPLTDALVEAALTSLDSLTVLNLLCLPGVIEQRMLAAAAAYGAKRKAFLIIDSDPNALTAQKLTTWMTGSTLPRTASAGVYGPWLRIPSPLAGPASISVGPSGSVAATFCRTDSIYGVWKAPAGSHATIVGATLSLDIPENETDALSHLGLNLLRGLPDGGTAVWGARTLNPASGNPNFQYVNVQRLALFLEGSILAGTQWATFEPNAAPLWAKLQLAVSTFLESKFRQGAFQGSSANQAYFVRCDSTTTTQIDIGAGIVNIVVGFAPLKPAEFVVLQIQALAGSGRCAVAKDSAC